MSSEIVDLVIIGQALLQKVEALEEKIKGLEDKIDELESGGYDEAYQY